MWLLRAASYQVCKGGKERMGRWGGGEEGEVGRREGGGEEEWVRVRE